VSSVPPILFLEQERNSSFPKGTISFDKKEKEIKNNHVSIGGE
jgi:hypothetical protein